MDRIDAKMTEGLLGGVFSGATLLVAREEDILYQGAWGQGVELTTLFDLSSLTKAIVTTTLTMILCQEEKLTLDQTVHHYWKGLDQPEKKKMTVRHLLKHMAGFPWWRPYFQELQKEHPEMLGTRQAYDAILEKVNQEALDYPIGYKKIYTDLGYMVLGRLVEEVSGQRLDHYFTERIKTPLGLQESFFHPLEEVLPLPPERFAPTEDCPWRKKVLCGEVHDDNAYAMGGVAGHAGLFQTIGDVHRYVQALIKAYSGDSSWLAPDIVQNFIGERLRLKLGWDTPAEKDSQAGVNFSRNTIGHLGFTGCSLWVDLEKKYWVILLTNRIHPSRNNNAIQIFRPAIHDLIYGTIFS